MDVELGKQVRYAIRFEDCTSEELAKYMTDGVLLRETLRGGRPRPYTPRSSWTRRTSARCNTDILGRLEARRRAPARPQAGRDVGDAGREKFSAFFGNAARLPHPRPHLRRVAVIHAKSPCEDHVDGAVKQALAIHLSYRAGRHPRVHDGPGGRRGGARSCAAPPRSSVPRAEAADPPPAPHVLAARRRSCRPRFSSRRANARKCVVATNIAETSLTVDGIYYVVDCGYAKLKVYNPRMGMDALHRLRRLARGGGQPAGRAGARGRASATACTPSTRSSTSCWCRPCPRSSAPTSATSCLLLKSLGIDDLLTFDFMDPPPQDNLLNSMYQLWLLGALDNTGSLTPLGRKMVELPLDPTLAKMLLFSEALGCVDDVATVVSALVCRRSSTAPRSARRSRTRRARSSRATPTSARCAVAVLSAGTRSRASPPRLPRPALDRRRRGVKGVGEYVNCRNAPVTTCPGFVAVRPGVHAGLRHLPRARDDEQGIHVAGAPPRWSRFGWRRRELPMFFSRRREPLQLEGEQGEAQGGEGENGQEVAESEAKKRTRRTKRASATRRRRAAARASS